MESVCEVCSAVRSLTDSYNEKLSSKNFPATKPTISSAEVATINNFISNLNHRACNCCFQELKQYSRLNNVIQGLLQTYIEQVKLMPARCWSDPPPEPPAESAATAEDAAGEDQWQLEQVERMLHLVVKLFQPQFPPYLAYKHVLPRPESAGGGGGGGGGGEPTVSYSAYCDVHDPEVSEFILRNVCYFCESGAIQAVTAAFTGQSPATLPLVLAHALLASVSNLKVWLNYRTIVQLLVPLRAAILKYMCKFSDGDLRSAASRSMSDFMWSSIKDPLDAPLSFDKDGLDLAFKFFTSSTLTMRLAGISQINNHINIFNELCNGESIVEAENVGLQLANWLIQNQMVEQLFGPNLHVEIVKQSHVVLSFLAVEGRLTNCHIELILQSAQLKHCSKQVYDILAPLIKNLEAEPVLHLYSLLQQMEPRDHTEQSLYLTSVLIKFIWSNGGTYSSVLDNVIKSLAGGDVSSSENSISMDASDDESELAAVQGPRREAQADGPEPNSSPSRQLPAAAAELPGPADPADSTRKRPEPGSGQLPEARQHVPTEESRRKRVIHCPSGQLSGRESSDDSSSAEGDGDGDAEPAARAGVKRRRRANPSPPAQRLLPAPAAAPGLGALVSVRAPPSPSLSSQDSQLDADVFAHDKLKTSLLKTELQQFKMQQIGRDLSDDEDSCSSRMSVKSEKNMADFEGEECVYEEELVQLAIQAQSQLPHHLASMASMYQARFGAVPPTLLSKARRPPPAAGSHLFARYGADAVCQPGNTLLWDLLNDERISELGEGMAAECEKILSNLLCYNSDRAIRKKFIEGCLQNMAQGRSVLVSLRMLPKLFASFQQFRGLDTHQITLWAEREHSMMQHFFNSLRQLSPADASASDASSLSTRQSEVQVRLHFLSTVFCSLGSPEHFRLSVEQVDALWTCLAHDPRHSDDLFSWMLSQVRGKEQHALGMDSLRYLLTEKLPSLDPAAIGMTALNLYQQLYQLLRLAGAPLADTEAVGMDQLWKIALRANNTDVSLAAIQYLNSCYVSGREERERQFVERCMCELASAGADLGQSDENSLLRIQRGLVLLKTHLQTYRKRFAYQVRCWQLEGHGVMSHAQLVGELAAPLRVLLQPAGSAEKKLVTLAHNNYVAELRAEVHAYWQQSQQAQQQAQQQQQQQQQQQGQSQQQGPQQRLCGPAGDGLTAATEPAQLRIISQGTELTPDCDDKLLTDVGFKDMQLVFISVGVSRPQRRSADAAAGSDGSPSRDSSPMLLLLEEKHFSQLLQLMNQLSSLRGPNSAPHTKAQVLSRRVWDILMVLPTSPQLKDGFGDLSAVTPATLHTLLDPHIPQKLMYSLYLVASLCSGKEVKEVQESDPDCRQQTHEWRQKFIECGGLQHLYDILMSGVLQLREADHWDEWRQDCLACLLQLLIQISVVRPESGPGAAAGPAPCSAAATSVTPEHAKKKARRQQRKWDQLAVLRLSPAMLSLMDLEAVAARLTSVLHDASLPRDPNHYKTGFWGRAQVVHYAMSLLVSLCYSAPEAADAMYRCDRYPHWVRRLLLEDPEPEMRREVASGLDRLCLGHADGGQTGDQFVAPILSELLKLMPVAAGVRPSGLDCAAAAAAGDEGLKEPYGPSCREYFGLVCRLLDSVDEPEAAELRLAELAQQCARSITERELLERRHQTAPDDGLVGLLKLCAALTRQAAAFKNSPAATQLVHELFDALFALPTPRERLLPKCKSVQSRSACYDLLVELASGCELSFDALLGRLLEQTAASRHSPYPWDYWPHEDGRSDCGYVGLTNLGATCYMASCMQHLYMMPQARTSILRAAVDSKCHHGVTLRELQRMFAYLLESERKAYNPRSFCKVYTMDHRPLNTGEQKDMAEFFIDLVSKLEEMTPELKLLVKQLFCGQITNNVVSLDCPHVSRTCEEFYTVRCQVADMRNLYESLDEVTVKDTLDGDNMYTCSQCQRKVRAEKRACFKRLPHILCFNTMRYTFNMNTMMREKVNTLFSFPLHLDMSGYLERSLMPNKCEDGGGEAEPESCQYDLIGVTVHTGTADGGHYYSFIRDRTASAYNSWLFFNDAEVKPFDPSQLAGECFGGEMTSKTYDSITDKFLDFSFEKTNSAYMLFYERCVQPPEQGGSKQQQQQHEQKLQQTQDPQLNHTEQHGQQPSQQPEKAPRPVSPQLSPQLAAELARPHLRPVELPSCQLSSELEDWIWKDNMEFLRDKSMFDHTFFNFMWQVCGYIPQTLSRSEAVTLRAARLSTTFFLEIFIHAKEKPTMVQWVELLTKQFNASQAACEWFLDHMATDEWWSIQILIKCPNQIVRQMFQRLCIHVVQKLRPVHSGLYLQPADGQQPRPSELGQLSCVTRFVRKLISLMEHGAKSHLRNLTEYFAFLFEFAKMGDTETKFLLATECITTMVNFYLSQIPENADEVSDEEEEDGETGGGSVPGPGPGPGPGPSPVRPADKFRPGSLEKMISLVALLVEKSRTEDQRLSLSASDLAAVAGGKGFPFLYHQIKDGLNVRATCSLVLALCRCNERLAGLLVGMIFQAVIKHQEGCQPFFRLLSLLVEGDSAAAAAAAGGGGGGSQVPCFTQLALQHIWEVAQFCPQPVLEWLAAQVPRNKLVHSWVLQNLDNWCEHFLIAHAQFRVRASASLLLVGLVPSTQFRHLFAQRQRQSSGELSLPPDALAVLHQVYQCLLRLLKPARVYTDVQMHGNMKLVQYFQLMQYCVLSRAEKLMFSPYTADLWTLFHPKLSEPSIAAHHNKQALLMFWCTVCIDCPENVQIIVTNPHITKNIGFNYILADHDDDQVVLFNRSTLPAYYGLLRLCCTQSRAFTRQLASHQNLQWAFKNITPYPAQYSAATDELLKLMSLFVLVHSDTTEQELREIVAFKRQTLQMYLQVLDARSSWATLISALKVLLDTAEDRLFLVYNGGVALLCEATLALHAMLHEATACHVTGELTELVRLLADTLRCCKTFRDNKDVRHALINCKERLEVMRKLVTLLNSFTPPELRSACIDALKEFVVVLPHESLQVLTPLMLHAHSPPAREGTDSAPPLGPYFPRPGQSGPASGAPSMRPARPLLQMSVPRLQLPANKCERDDYDRALLEYFLPYHVLADLMCRVAINHDLLTEPLVTLSVLLGIDGVPLHLAHFAKLWIDVYQTKAMEKHIERLLSCSHLAEYLQQVLLTARPSLTNSVIYKFCSLFLPKVSWERWSPVAQLSVLADQVTADLVQLSDAAATAQAQLATRLTGQLRALSLLYYAAPPPPPPPPPLLLAALQQTASKLDLPAAPAPAPVPPPAPEPGPAHSAPLSTTAEQSDSASGAESSGSAGGGGSGEPAEDSADAAGWHPVLARSVQLLRDQLTTSKACDRRV